MVPGLAGESSSEKEFREQTSDALKVASNKIRAVMYSEAMTEG